MATLEPGEQSDTIIRSVGFKANFHFEKCDCEHHNVDLIICVPLVLYLDNVQHSQDVMCSIKQLLGRPRDDYR